MFCNQSVSYKSSWSISDSRPFGYIAVGHESTNEMQDCREVFSIETFPASRVALRIDKQFAINQLPDSFDFRLESHNVLNRLHELSLMIAELLCESLHRNKDYLSIAFQDNASKLRLTKYPTIYESMPAFIFESSPELEFCDQRKGPWIDVQHHKK